jgi:muramoyltetrapeptide carboxypeptidase
MITPPFLKPGDKIAITAPSRYITPEELRSAIKIFNDWGFEVVTGKYIYNRSDQFGGTDNERSQDFQEKLDDPSVKAVIAARGGYGAIRTLTNLNFDQFVLHPKWIIGYSDITFFHSHINQNLKIKTLHASMPINFSNYSPDDNSLIKIKKVLIGNQIEYSWDSNPLNRQGEATAELTGGNLSVLYSLRGTPYDLITKNKILFIEDVDEYLYHIDRMMMNFKLGNKLNELSALVVGGMTDMKDNKVPFGKSAVEIINDTVRNYNYPVCFDLPAGHIKNNFPLILGNKYKLTIKDKTCVLKTID